jgi:hypothetical protein
MRRAPNQHHPSFGCFRIDLVDLHYDVMLGAGDTSTQALLGEDAPVRAENDRSVMHFVLERRATFPYRLVWTRRPIVLVLSSSMHSA